MKIKIHDLIFVEVLGTLLQIPLFFVLFVYLKYLYFNLLEILVLQVRGVFSTAQLEMGSGVVLVSSLIPTEPLTALWKRDFLSSFPNRIIHRSFQERERELLWPGPSLGSEWMTWVALTLRLIKSYQPLISKSSTMDDRPSTQ